MDAASKRFSMVAVLLAGLAAATSPTAAQGQGSDPPGGDFGRFFASGDASDAKVTVEAQFAAAKDGQPAGLFVTARIAPNWHIYSITQEPGGPRPTLIELTPSPSYRLLGDFRPSVPPEAKQEPLFDNLTVETHSGAVTWYAPIELASGVDPSTLKIEGIVKAQPCDADNCLPRQSFPFTATLGPGLAVPPARSAQAPAVMPTAAPATTQAPAAASEPATASARGGAGLPWQPYTTFDQFRGLLAPSFDPEVLQKNVADASNLWRNVLLGFLGGIILNLMPCVLPVIGLKVLSFVEQSGHDRRRALMLNVWYSAGLLSVFLLLATLAVLLSLPWGGLFKSAEFNVVLAAVVFAMGLSFLGVWEIPIPGFAGMGKAAAVTQHEGFAGAFAKGVITTILATPCTGPFMGTALAWAVSQPPIHTYAVFLSIGLGMASPYLVIGAFPRLVAFLPKPGAWMETFKQVMGFVLMGTVVYIFTFLRWPYLVPTLGLLLSVSLACWWIARTPLTADATAKARAWLEGAVVVGVAWLLLFPGIDEIVPGRYSLPGLYEQMAKKFDERLEWNFQSRLAGYKLVPAGDQPIGPNTVLVDFTADWCLTCKTFEATVLNTPEVKELVEHNGVIPVKADWTDEAPEVTRLMRYLRAAAVPTVVVFPADDPNRPTGVFRGAYTKSELLEALRRAGPSRSAVARSGAHSAVPAMGPMAERPGAAGL